MSQQERQFIIQRAKALGKEVPKDLLDDTPKHRELLSAFYFLSQRRAGEYQPIADSAIMEYVCYYGTFSHHPADFLGLMQRIDGHYLQEKAKKAKADLDAEKGRARNARS